MARARGEFRRFCTVDGCGSVAHGQGLCQTHLWRKKNGWPEADLADPIDRAQSRSNPLPAMDRAVEAAIALVDVDAEDDDAYLRAKDRFRKAMLSYAESIGYRRGTAAEGGGESLA